MNTHKGHCLCRSVEFEVQGEPSDVINCHCHFCQRATGSAYLVETLFDKGKLRITRGEPKVYDHVSEGSGKTIHIHFCGNCGTKLFMTFDRFPASVGVFSGTFETPDWFERTPDNTQHFFLSKAPKGVVLPVGYAVYDAHYWLRDGEAAKPVVFSEPTEVSDELRSESEARARKAAET